LATLRASANTSRFEMSLDIGGNRESGICEKILQNEDAVGSCIRATQGETGHGLELRQIRTASNLKFLFHKVTLQCKVDGMSELHKALGDISTIRRQMAHSTQFRGYGPATLAATGIFAFLAASLQSTWLKDPANHIPAYLSIWVSTAVLSAALTGVQMYTRTRRIHSGLSNEMIRMAVEQFLPAVGAGILITTVLVRFVPAIVWMLPGLWQVIFSLGIFSSCRFLPRPMIAAGAWYLLTGLVRIALGDSRALAPWTMGLAFGAGQLLVAAILFVASQEDADEN
jgi:hypothetical protein